MLFQQAFKQAGAAGPCGRAAGQPYRDLVPGAMRFGALRPVAV